MNFSDNVTLLKGVGQKKAALLKKLNIETVGELLNFYPRSYQDRRTVKKIAEILPGSAGLFSGTVIRIVNNQFIPGKKKMLKITIDDGSSRAEIVFFNAAYLANIFIVGKEYYFYGRAGQNSHPLQFIHPDFSAEMNDAISGILPVYPLTEGIGQNEMRKWQREAQESAKSAEEFLPEDIIRRHHLCSYAYALSNIHFPQDEIRFKEAKYRLIFDEMLVLQTGLFAVKAGSAEKKKGISFSREVDVSEYIDSLSYPLTSAQKRAVSEIIGNMESETVMNRLLQGDVGSGKTAVAEIAMFKAARSGFQAVLMAPTEILAKQHYDGIKNRFSAFGIETGFLSGSVNKKEREETLARLQEGRIAILIGTHAVIQPDVKFQNLGLVITDEQHRFGVNHRALLGEKGKNPDMLVMTATPIPRTLAVILYGDLDVSVIDELPPGRKKIITRAVDGNNRNAVYSFVRKQLEKGHQAYVVTSLIEDSETMTMHSAESVYTELSGVFEEFEVALLHGELKQKEKDQIMMRFAKGAIDVLVSTVVIEVGINVPNATVMVIENSERFGLAQMHQLRGRVGRGGIQSYCILIHEGKSEVARARAEIMESTADGFVIAEKDLELRGPGEFFGTRQHGLPDLQIANLIKHTALLETVKKEAVFILKEDPTLQSEKYAPLKAKILQIFQGSLDLRL